MNGSICFECEPDSCCGRPECVVSKLNATITELRASVLEAWTQVELRDQQIEAMKTGTSLPTYRERERLAEQDLAITELRACLRIAMAWSDDHGAIRQDPDWARCRAALGGDE